MAPQQQGTKGERKAFKLFEKVGLKAAPSITKVTIKRPKNVLITIQHPQVWVTTDGKTYIVIGEPKFEDLTQSAKQQMAQLLQQQQLLAQQQSHAHSHEGHDHDHSEHVEEEEEEEDATGLDSKDIELVQSQAHVSRNKAIRALKDNENDVVNAIMELTM
eukprot:NODE_506_length_7505_cov_0.263705.p3 type:complete len:160 gc:universal NODE_506_length_7505_cov_0.263705:5844-6323(+)